MSERDTRQPPTLLDEDPPVIVHTDPPARAPGDPALSPPPPSPRSSVPRTAASVQGSLPALDAIPDLDVFDVPEHTPFTYEDGDRLTPEKLDGITAYHAKWMQTPSLKQRIAALPTLEQRRVLMLQAQGEARAVLPNLQQQYREACEGVGAAQSQQALSVARNLAWVEDLLARTV